jgi:pimeloyl-ACP methyl ester carboxylesterase
LRRIPVRVETEIMGAPGWVAADVFAPEADVAIKPAVLFCFPGGGVTRDYYDIQGDSRNSFARALTGLGFVCATFDHPGCGGSSVPADGFALDAASVAAAGAAAVRYVAARLRDGLLDASLPALGAFAHIGVGHSMGAMIVCVQQAALPLYHAAALLCFTTRGLPEALNEEEQAAAGQPSRTSADYARLARARFGVPFPTIASPRSESATAVALAGVQGALTATCALQSMLPGNIAQEAGSITIPLFLAAGDRDLTGPPHAIPASFTACNDLRLVVVQGAGHHPFVTAGAPHLFKTLAGWAACVGENL